MHFIHPYWLFGLLAIAVPIIIHLFNFRRYRKYYFTNLTFLKSIKKETQKQHRIRHLLVLMSRIMAIFFLVVAFARPYLPGPEGIHKQEMSYVCVYLDNSMSMQASANGHRLLDEALAKAAEVARASKPSDRFQLITNDFEGKHQQYYNRDEFLKLLDDVDISSRWRETSEVLKRIHDMAGQNVEDPLQCYIISDFQKASTNMEAFLSDTISNYYLLPVIGNELGNVYIDSCWFTYPYNHLGRKQDLNIRLVNASDIDLEKIPVRFSIGGKQRGLATFDIESRGTAEIKIPFSNHDAGIQKGKASIDDYPVTWDNDLLFTWSVKDKIPVLSISEKNPGYYIESLYGNDSVFLYNSSELKRINYGGFSTKDLIILDNIREISSGLASELSSYVQEGGSLLIIPSADAEIINMNSFLNQLGIGSIQAIDTSRLMVTGLNTRHELFDDVFESIPENLDLPTVYSHYPLRNYRSASTDVIMDLQNGDPLITLSRFGKGKVYFTASPAGDDFGNLPRHALWVPVMYRMAMLSRPQDELYYTVSKDNSLRTAELELISDQSLQMKLSGAEYSFIPGFHSSGDHSRLFLYDQLKQAGHYDLYLNDKLITTFSFNYDRKESDPAIYTSDDLEQYENSSDLSKIIILDVEEKPVSEAVNQINKGVELWKYCIWLALLFILFEVLLLRLWRK